MRSTSALRALPRASQLAPLARGISSTASSSFAQPADAQPAVTAKPPAVKNFKIYRWVSSSSRLRCLQQRVAVAKAPPQLLQWSYV